MIAEENKTVLVVEDNPAVNSLFSRYFKGMGISVHSVFGVNDAIRCLQSSVPPALVILDLILEDGNGRQVLDYLHNYHGVKIIIVSSQDADSEDGLDDYPVEHRLVKPVSPADLWNLAKAIL